MDAGRADRPVPAGAVVVGYDETAAAGRALAWAADLAAHEARTLVLLHATGPLGSVATTWLNLSDPATEPTVAELERHGQAVLARATARAGLGRPTLRVVPHVALSEPAPELERLSRTAHLVVVGSRGHHLTRSVPTGQVGSWLSRRTECPLVVVPDFDPRTVRQGVCVGLPAGDEVGAVLDFAYAHASAHALPLTVVHATKDTTPATEEDRRRWLAEALSGHAERHPDVRTQTVLVAGRPARTLLRMAERMDLLVVGRHSATGLRELPGGHVRSSIVDRSPCPTVVVPARGTHRGALGDRHGDRHGAVNPA